MKTWKDFIKLVVWLVETVMFGAMGLFFILIVRPDYCPHYDTRLIGWFFITASITIGIGLYPYRENKKDGE